MIVTVRAPRGRRPSRLLVLYSTPRPSVAGRRQLFVVFWRGCASTELTMTRDKRRPGLRTGKVDYRRHLGRGRRGDGENRPLRVGRLPARAPGVHRRNGDGDRSHAARRAPTLVLRRSLDVQDRGLGSTSTVRRSAPRWSTNRTVSGAGSRSAASSSARGSAAEGGRAHRAGSPSGASSRSWPRRRLRADELPEGGRRFRPHRGRRGAGPDVAQDRPVVVELCLTVARRRGYAPWSISPCSLRNDTDRYRALKFSQPHRNTNQPGRNSTQNHGVRCRGTEAFAASHLDRAIHVLVRDGRLNRFPTTIIALRTRADGSS